MGSNKFGLATLIASIASVYGGMFWWGSVFSSAGPPGPPVCTAVYTRNYKEAQRFLDSGVSPNTTNDLGEPLLGSAAARGDAKMIRLLVFAGADVTATWRRPDEIHRPYGGTFFPSEGMTTALNAAIESRCEESVTALLDLGAVEFWRLHDQSVLAVPPLHDAVLMDSPIHVRRLLEHGCDPYAVDEEGRTPLEWGEQLQSGYALWALKDVLNKREARVNLVERWAF